jgi:hypothetical protein
MLFKLRELKNSKLSKTYIANILKDKLESIGRMDNGI